VLLLQFLQALEPFVSPSVRASRKVGVLAYSLMHWLPEFPLAEFLQLMPGSALSVSVMVAVLRAPR
jgi:hypothetical protein